MRTYYLAIESDLANYKKLCVGNQPRHKVMLDYTKEVIILQNKIKFSTHFSFIVDF